MQHNSRTNYINATFSEAKRDKNGKTYFELIPDKPINPEKSQLFGGGGGFIRKDGGGGGGRCYIDDYNVLKNGGAGY